MLLLLLLLLHTLGYWCCLDSGRGSSVIWGMYGVSGWWNCMFCSLDCTQLPSSSVTVMLWFYKIHWNLLPKDMFNHINIHDYMHTRPCLCGCFVMYSRSLQVSGLVILARHEKARIVCQEWQGPKRFKFSKAWKVASLTHPNPSKQPPYWFDWFDCNLFIWGLKGLQSLGKGQGSKTWINKKCMSMTLDSAGLGTWERPVQWPENWKTNSTPEFIGW